MIDYGQFRYSGPPRCASTWCLKVFADAGLGVGSKAKVHIPPEPSQMALDVSTVRNPIDWLCSYWNALRGGHTGVLVVDFLMSPARRAQTVVQFLEFYLEEQPGAVGRIHRAYAADTVLRIEDFPWAMQEFLESVGIPSKWARDAVSLPPQNVYNGEACGVGKRLRRRIVAAEAEFCETYEYW